MARKKSGSSVFGLLILGLLALLGSIPKEIWIAIGILIAVIAIATMFGKKKKVSSPTVAGKPIVPSATAQQAAPSARGIEVMHRIQSGRNPERAGYRIPAPPKGLGAARWYSSDEVIEIAGRRLAGGMLYAGTSLPCSAGGNDPCLIDPSKKVDSAGDFTLRQTNYWPSYSEISSSARAAYLDWLADGRRHPEADIGYVFIFFYGLERRVVLDVSNDPAAKKDWPAIRDELTRLVKIYGKNSGSFKGYASALLNWMQLSQLSSKTYNTPLADLAKGYELPMPLRVALGQAAVDAAPLPAHLALSWVKMAPDLNLRTAATRCAEEFDQYFSIKYQEKFGAGMILQRNRTKLCFVYRPASAGFRGAGELRLDLGDLPDVTAVTTPIKKLREVAEEATDALDGYSRFLGRNPDASGSLEALLQLPASLWPDSAQQAVKGLKKRMGEGMVLVPCRELLDLLKAQAVPTKDRFVGLARALESLQMGIEPDVLGGVRVPKPDDNVVLFSIPSAEQMSRSSPEYQTAVLTLQLASAVASADGKCDAIELAYLSKQVKSWTHLSPNHQRRLMAQLRLLSVAPVSLAAIKKKLEPLDQSTRVTIATFMATVAQSGGTVTPAEVKMLEKIYGALGVDQGKVFSDVHAAATGATSPSKGETEKRKFTLDSARITALQRDTELAATMLTNIFSEEPIPVPEMPASHPEQEAAHAPPGLLGMDEAHSALARLLLSRREWVRADLQDAAADLELMLDGALEHINEACFDKFDMPLIEGDDPVSVNSEIREKIAA
jgi:uncharacterized tellurite resistance protein B-like protein